MTDPATTSDPRPGCPPLPADWWHDRIATVSDGRLVVNTRFRAALADAGLAEIDALLTGQVGQSLAKPSLPPHRQRLRVVLDSASPAPTAIYLKRYRPPLGKRLRRWLTPGAGSSEAADEWRAIWELARARLPVPEPVLLGERGCPRAARQSCIALAELPGAQSLERWLPDAGPALPADRRRELARRLGCFLAHFHATGLVHRDCYLSHIFVSFPQGPQEGGLFHLIDLARVFRPRRRRRRWRVKDLAQLLYSTRRHAPFVGASDAMRLLLAYLGRRRLDGGGKALARAVQAKAARIARHAGPPPAERG